MKPNTEFQGISLKGTIQPDSLDKRMGETGIPGLPLFRRHWGFAAVLAFWTVLLFVNVFELAPSLRFRGVRFGGGDFCQYYMGGVVAHEGMWTDLYPLDLAAAPRPDKSAVSARLSDAMKRRNAYVSWKFIYPPPLAVFIGPFDLLSFVAARKVFTCLLFGAVVWFLALFRSECDDWDLQPDLSNFLVLAVGTGLPVCESVMMANATPFVMLASLLALRSLRRNHAVGTVFSFALAGLFKGVSAVWVPLLFLRRRRRILAICIVAGAAVLILPHLLGAPLDLWKTFLRDVVPGSRKLYWIGDGNLGLPSLLAWLSGGSGLSVAAKRSLGITQIAVLVSAYVLAWRAGRKDAATAEGLALFLATLAFQLFSPICWPHYACNVVGFLPLCLAVAGVHAGRRLRGQQWISTAVLAIAFLLVWYPIGNLAKYAFHAPILGFGRTAGYLLMLFWGLGTLVRLARNTETLDT